MDSPKEILDKKFTPSGFTIDSLLSGKHCQNNTSIFD
jgi:hypothetical protein